jgi:hypothetical protein
LTSEDTATGGGAASCRTPKFYDCLEENIDPVSEQFHEYMMFPTKDMVETFQSYLNYMSGVHYIYDGNPILIQKGFVTLPKPGDKSTNNEQPLYITKYDNKFGEYYCRKCSESKRKETLRKNFGVDYPIQNKKVFNKMKNTLIEKYGVDNISKRNKQN